MSFFDEFLKTVPAADQEVLNRYPALKASTEQMERDIQVLAPHAKTGIEWESWKTKNWDDTAGMTRAEKELRSELAAAQARVTAGTGSNADVNAVAAQLRKEMADQVKAVQENSAKQLSGMHYFYRAAANHLLPHQQEFGENLDPQVLIDYMTTNHIQDADVAYDKMVAGKRAEISTKREGERQVQQKADLEAAEKRGYEKAAQERMMGNAGMSPTDQTGGITGITAHVGGKALTVSDEEKSIIANAKLESGELAKLGYKMYLRGDFGSVH
jgi:hypothetical protein